MGKSMDKVIEYTDELHGEDLDGITVGEHDYKYRMLEGIMMPPYITPNRYKLSRTLETREGDICFISFPKSGSTWLSHIIYLLVHNGQTPEGETLRSSLHWVASSWPYPRSKEELDALPSPRIFKSHMPYHMAVGGTPTETPCKYIYIARNPKDVAVSYFHFESGKKWSGNYSGTWEHWLDAFMNGNIQRGDWFDHMLSWWQHKDADNILFLRYEELKEDFDKVLEQLSHFLGYPLNDQLRTVIKEKTAFSTMKQDDFSSLHEIPELGSFFRKGQIGSWKDRFTVAQSEAFDRYYAERTKGYDIEFKFD